MTQAQEIQRLKDRIEELEELAGIGDDDVTLIRSAIGLPLNASKILGAIRKRRGVASRDMIFAYVYGDRPECDQPDYKIIDVQMVLIRKKLRPSGIAVKAVWGAGYTMDDADRAALTSLMEAQLPAERRAA